MNRYFLRDEYGVEAYYNFALTPWMKFTPDIQVVRPAQKNELNSDGPTDGSWTSVRKAWIRRLSSVSGSRLFFKQCNRRRISVIVRTR